MKCCSMCGWGVVSIVDPQLFGGWAEGLMETLYNSHVETHVEDFRIELGLMTPGA